jgi:DNA-binding response OmpR family regulator
LDVEEQRLIMVVEDDEATRKFLLDNLAADGFRVAGASSAGEGLRAIEVRQPKLVVLDLALEESSGLDLLDRLRAADGLASRLDPDLPVIVLTGRTRDAGRVRSFARGADDHVNKPTCHLFFRAVDAHLGPPAPCIQVIALASPRSGGHEDVAQMHGRAEVRTACASAS